MVASFSFDVIASLFSLSGEIEHRDACPRAPTTSPALAFLAFWSWLWGHFSFRLL